MFVDHIKFPPNTNKVKGYNMVISFASGYGSVKETC